MTSRLAVMGPMAYFHTREQFDVYEYHVCKITEPLAVTINSFCIVSLDICNDFVCAARIFYPPRSFICIKDLGG